jgi:membrane protease subunit HflK
MIATAEGDASRFRQVLTEYSKAPEVTRQRLYLETLQQIYTNTSKIMVDAKGAGNLLYLPLDKIMQATPASSGPAPGTMEPITTTAPRSAPVSNEVPPQMEKAPSVERSGDFRSRSSLSSRERGDR